MSNLMMMHPGIPKSGRGDMGQWFARSSWIVQANNGGTLSITNGAGGGAFTISQASIPNFTAGLARVTIPAVGVFVVGAYGGGTSVTLTGCPNVSAVAFTVETLRDWRYFLPGTGSGQNPRYKTCLVGHGTGGKGLDNLLQMNGAGEIPQSAGWPNASTGLQWNTTAPFGRRNWPFLTICPQSAGSSQGTSEKLALYDTIRAEIETLYPCDPLRRYACGLSDGGYALAAYVAGRASQFAMLVMEAAVCTQFYFSNFATGYTGTTNADARAFAAAQFSANGVALRQYVGSLDSSYATSDYNGDVAAFQAAYASAGISSKYVTSVDEPTFAQSVGEHWDHVTTYTRVNQSPLMVTDMLAQHR